MDYSYLSDTHSQPFGLYSLHRLPTPDPNQVARTDADDLQDAFSALVCKRHIFFRNDTELTE